MRDRILPVEVIGIMKTDIKDGRILILIDRGIVRPPNAEEHSKVFMQMLIRGNIVIVSEK